MPDHTPPAEQVHGTDNKDLVLAQTRSGEILDPLERLRITKNQPLATCGLPPRVVTAAAHVAAYHRRYADWESPPSREVVTLGDLAEVILASPDPLPLNCLLKQRNIGLKSAAQILALFSIRGLLDEYPQLIAWAEGRGANLCEIYNF